MPTQELISANVQIQDIETVGIKVSEIPLFSSLKKDKEETVEEEPEVSETEEKETKKEETAAANNTVAEAESKPITENNVSTNITEKLKETTSDIFVEIIIPDMAE